KRVCPLPTRVKMQFCLLGSFVVMAALSIAPADLHAFGFDFVVQPPGVLNTAAPPDNSNYFIPGNTLTATLLPGYVAEEFNYFVPNTNNLNYAGTVYYTWSNFPSIVTPSCFGAAVG